MSLDGVVSGTGGAVFNASSPFQVGECASLAFKPKLDFRLFGGTHRGSHPKFRATLTMPEGGANIASASVALPHSEFLDQGHIGTVCTRVQFAAEACPAASIYGTVIGGSADCPAPAVEVQTFEGGVRAKEPFYIDLYR